MGCYETIDQQTAEPPEPVEPVEPSEPPEPAESLIIGKKINMFFLYLDVQLQEAQVHTVSICEYANMFTLCDG